MVIFRRQQTDLCPPSTGGGLLTGLGVAPEPWMGEANCLGTDPEIFFPEQGAGTKDARTVCSRCPVTAQCLAYAHAIETGAYGTLISHPAGIWGGTTPKQRSQIRRRNNPALEAS